jgi:RNA-directed DNA polymerase
VLTKRLEKYHLEVATDKTNRIRFSRFEPNLKNTFTCLSLEFYWGYDKTGKSRLFRRTSRKRLQSVKNALSDYIQKHRHKRTPALLDKLTQKLRGHYNYFGVVSNLGDLFTVYFHAVGKLYKWLNRRSGRKSMTWKKLKRVTAYRELVKPICKAPTKRMKV